MFDLYKNIIVMKLLYSEIYNEKIKAIVDGK